MNTDYDEKTYPGPGATSPTGIDLMQLFVAPTYALKLHPKHAIGSAPYSLIRVSGRGLGAFSGISTSDDNLTDNDHE